MKALLSSILGCMLAGIIAPATLAQESVIDGNWIFEADTRSRCTLEGTLQLVPLSDGSAMACEIIARQTCPSRKFVVSQSCEIERNDTQLIIISTIDEFLEGEPTPRYLPDNFALVIEDSATMVGQLLSGHTSIRAKFWRTNQGIS